MSSRGPTAPRVHHRLLSTWIAGLMGLSSVLLLAAQAGAQSAELDEVLFQASQSVLAFERSFSSIVAQESYTQRIVTHEDDVKRTRELASDFLLVRPPTLDTWIGFRDVFEVDGRQVRNRQKRLQNLFIKGERDALDQARKVAEESARYNIGRVQRTINLPTMALLVLHPLNQFRFYFEKQREQVIEGMTVWAIRFSEHSRPTLIRSGRVEVFTRGTLWVDPENGRLVRSELIAGDSNSRVRSRTVVQYGPDPEIGSWVPVQMEEYYDDPRNPKRERIEGRAVYSNFRRFEVQVEEEIKVPQ